MKKLFDKYRLWLLVGVACSVAGCAGDGCPGGSSTPLSQLEHHFVYVSNSGSDNISIFEATADGQMTSLGTMTAGDGPGDIALISRHRVLYCLNQTAGTISQYRINDDGKLTPLNPPTVPTGPNPVAIDTNGGSKVYVACNGDESLKVYDRGSSGALTFNQSLPLDAGVADVRVSSKGGVYVTIAGLSNHVRQFVQQGNTLAPYNPPFVNANTSPGDIVFGGKGAYVAQHGGNGSVIYYSLSTTAGDHMLNEVQERSIPSGADVIASKERESTIFRIYAASNTSHDLSVVSHGVNDVLTVENPLDLNLAAGISDMEFTKNGNYELLYMVSRGENHLRSYNADTFVVPIQTIATGSQPAAVAVTDPSEFDLEQPLRITTTSLPATAVGNEYQAQIAKTGGNENPITWSLAAGNLPRGLRLTPSDTGATVTIQGKPDGGGTFNFTIQAQQVGNTDTQDYTLTISGTSGTATQGRVLNAAVAVPNIDAFLHPIVQIADALPSKVLNGYVDIPSGNQNLRVFASASGAELFNSTVSITAGSRTTFIPYGNSTLTTPVAIVSKQRNYQPPVNKSTLRVVNTTPVAIDVVIVPLGKAVGDPEAIRVPVGATGTVKQVDVPAGNYFVHATAPNGTATLGLRQYFADANSDWTFVLVQNSANNREFVVGLD